MVPGAHGSPTKRGALAASAAAARALLPALVTEIFANDTLRLACSLVLSAFAAFGGDPGAEAPPADDFDPADGHPVPVVFVHGFLGNSSHFSRVRSFLAARGIRSFAAFSYPPEVDHERLALRLGEMIEGVCLATGAPQVDVVGHSLGGLIARHMLETGASRRVRRLITLGAPFIAPLLAPQELAIFGGTDVLIAAPDPVHGPHGRTLLIPRCGHLGLLRHLTVLRAVAAFLAAPAEEELEWPGALEAA
jgi:pimeloyl-ACP methyl ester carboxylesterase